MCKLTRSWATGGRRLRSDFLGGAYATACGTWARVALWLCLIVPAWLLAWLQHRQRHQKPLELVHEAEAEREWRSEARIGTARERTPATVYVGCRAVLMHSLRLPDRVGGVLQHTSRANAARTPRQPQRSRRRRRPRHLVGTSFLRRHRLRWSRMVHQAAPSATCMHPSSQEGRGLLAWVRLRTLLREHCSAIRVWAAHVTTPACSRRLLTI